MIDVTIRGQGETDDYLGLLRYLDDRYLTGAARRWLDHFLDLHTITVDRGPEDYWVGSDIPLRNALSLLDADHRRRRVSEIVLHLNDRA